ncbi:MAG: ATP-binding cassette domain-containing protein [Clostridia bacterium]|nr:ATP-binding cassette domain-containing protein [Clostridia bacterium]
MIKAINACLTYPDKTKALKPFDLSLDKTEIAYVTGPSGSGKTSFFKLVMGMEYPSGGTIEVLGESIRPGNERGMMHVRTCIGPVFQDFRLLEGRSVYDNVVFGLRFLDMPAHQMKLSAIESIQRVGLEHKIRQSIDRLSWGESQRVAIARAIARKPELIIADEPTGNLDHDNAVKILELLESFRSDDTGVIIITHASHLIDMKKGGVFISINEGSVKIERRPVNA